MKKISLLIPAYNEEQSLPVLYPALCQLIDGPLSEQYEFEVLFVNDGSSDNTLALIEQLRERDKRICYVDLSRNFGKENALLAGIDYVKGDCAIIMDADLQHPLSVVPEMIKYWNEGYDDVYGSRITRGKESWIRKTLTKWFYDMLQGSSKVNMLPNVGDFRLLDRKCINALKKLRETERYTKGLYCWVGFKKKDVQFETQDSVRDTSSFSLRSLMHLAIQGLTSFSVTPLRVSAVIGFIISIFAFLYLIYIVFKTIFVNEPVSGFPTIMVTMLFLGGVQLLAIGIIGEYIGKIYNESKNRPVYLINTYNGETEDKL